MSFRKIAPVRRTVPRQGAVRRRLVIIRRGGCGRGRVIIIGRRQRG